MSEQPTDKPWTQRVRQARLDIPPTCDTCLWWDPIGKGDGLCRRLPPVVFHIGNLESGIQYDFTFPTTGEACWCREHEPKDAE